MLVPAMVLATVSVWIEMLLVTKNAHVRKFLTKYEICGLIFSFVLSVAIGEPFGAQGVTALLGAMISTGVTAIIYKFHLLKQFDKYKDHEDEIKAKVRKVSNDLMRALQFWYKVIIFIPVTIPRWIKAKVKKIASGASAVKTKIQDFLGRAKRAIPHTR